MSSVDEECRDGAASGGLATLGRRCAIVGGFLLLAWLGLTLAAGDAHADSGNARNSHAGNGHARNGLTGTGDGHPHARASAALVGQVDGLLGTLTAPISHSPTTPAHPAKHHPASESTGRANRSTGQAAEQPADASSPMVGGSPEVGVVPIVDQLLPSTVGPLVDSLSATVAGSLAQLTETVTQVTAPAPPPHRAVSPPPVHSSDAAGRTAKPRPARPAITAARPRRAQHTATTATAPVTVTVPVAPRPSAPTHGAPAPTAPVPSGLPMAPTPVPDTGPTGPVPAANHAGGGGQGSAALSSINRQALAPRSGAIRADSVPPLLDRADEPRAWPD